MPAFHKHSEYCIGAFKTCPECKGNGPHFITEDDEGYCERCASIGVVECWACQNIFEKACGFVLRIFGVGK